MIVEFREVYCDTFCLFLKNNSKPVDEDLIRKVLDIFFDYAEENDLDILSLSLDDATTFLQWFEREKKENECYPFMFRMLMDFYDLLVLVDYAAVNPFEKLWAEEIMKVLKAVKEQFPEKLFIDFNTGKVM